MDEDDEWDYIEEGPAEIIWQGNEIIVKKKRVRVAKGTANKMQSEAVSSSYCQFFVFFKKDCLFAALLK